ncbi:branched-chain amino acid ABC transporter permease [Roseospira marina]|uniref:Branched-chain amino acid ABC transporter permease n=1 Tax=Roseospira marina TaxID=140057 RepID=A0A5M6IEK4_9PROT|nr:branched-chain amino acid ABC transporter permease [Roseospira marina]KAA5606145.1 branched-chain amino acid ABC transporter permease [Roseospira marina]MBB4314284.1 branched-chain amino acid transport system permease protein [Roseospira marina]MBB5087444.1 branched-chain amino acid transport system permease protein [Roseospira marina]
MSDYAIQQIVNGLSLGSLYALVAIGFSLIYGVIRLVNFAHGDLMMVGAFATFGLIATDHVPWVVLPLLVLVAGFLSGGLVERLAFRSIRGAPMITGFIVTLSVSVALQNLGLILLGAQPRNFSFPAVFRERVALGGIDVAIIDLTIPAVTLLCAVLLTVFVKTTRMGIAMRAVSENTLAARLMGISINRVVLLVFGIGGALAALAGLFWGGKFGQIDPLMGFVPGLKAFVATIIGGVGSLPGAILGGYILGFAEVAFVGFLPAAYAGYRDAFVFGLLILILLVRPSGLFGSTEEERA